VRRTATEPDNSARQSTGPQTEGTCSEANPPLFVVCVQLPENPYRSSGVEHRAIRKAGLSSIERYGGRVTVVVVGVTSHQGTRESRVQGEGSQVLSSKYGNGQRC